MKKVITAILAFIVVLASCKKNDKTLNEPFDKSNAIELNRGIYINSSQEVSGCARVYTKDNNRYLVFENFKATAGPDLKVYFSTSTTNNDVVSLGDLKATGGNFSYCIPANIDISSYKYILIWCEDFKKLFGYAVLN